MSPPSYLLAVFATLLAIISPSSSCSSYSWNKWNVRHFFFHNQNNSTSSPGLLANGAITCSGLHFWRHFVVKNKILRNFVISNWLWLIMPVLLANQNWGKARVWILNNAWLGFPHDTSVMNYRYILLVNWPVKWSYFKICLKLHL